MLRNVERPSLASAYKFLLLFFCQEQLIINPDPIKFRLLILKFIVKVLQNDKQDATVQDNLLFLDCSIIIIIFNLRTAAFKGYCAIWVRRSNFRHQASPRMSPSESTQRRKVELWARNVREFYLNADLHLTFWDLLHAVKLRHGTDGFTSPPKEGVLRNFSPLKIRRLRPGANPRTWVPKARMLPLDHRSRLSSKVTFAYLVVCLSVSVR